MSSPLTSEVAGSACTNNATCNGETDYCCANKKVWFFETKPKGAICLSIYHLYTGNSFTM